jgi:type II restriction/modification system DNA methylase subunit YeeA
MKAEGYTAKELADLLDISYENVRKRLEKAGIKPITKDAIYPYSALETIRIVGPVGRPRKKSGDEQNG